MAQFDVHRNRGAHTSAIPYLLIVQSRRFDGFGRRLTIPLVEAHANPVTEPSLNPPVTVEGRSVILHTLHMASIPENRLGEFVCSLDADGDRIINAIDLLISRAWG